MQTRAEWFEFLKREHDGQLPPLIFRGQGVNFTATRALQTPVPISLGAHLYVTRLHVWGVNAASGAPTTWPFLVAFGIPEGLPWLGQNPRLVAEQRVASGAWVAEARFEWPRLIGFTGSATQKTASLTIDNTLNAAADIGGYAWIEGYQITSRAVAES